MPAIPDSINTWQMAEGPVIDKETRKVTTPGKFAKTTIPVPELGPDEALVKIAGCGVCHTDLSYFYEGVPTVNKPPLTLGHEISGEVVAGPGRLMGKNVLIPAVMPCNKPDCPICSAGRGNRCLDQKMPGSSLGIYGGFSDYIPVPADDLCVIEDLKGIPLEHYSVVADACTTPYQAGIRAEVGPGDRVMVFGACGGVGTYMTQFAKAMGADVVVGLDINECQTPERSRITGRTTLSMSRIRISRPFATNSGPDLSMRPAFPTTSAGKYLKSPAWELPRTWPWGSCHTWASSSSSDSVWPGISTSISRLMAFDAEIIGTWGCLPQILQQRPRSGAIRKEFKIEPFLEIKPMSQIAQKFSTTQHHGLFRQASGFGYRISKTIVFTV